jgi:hypothetical protein
MATNPRTAYGANVQMVLKLRHEIEEWLIEGLQTREVYERCVARGLACGYTNFFPILGRLDLLQNQVRARFLKPPKKSKKRKAVSRRPNPLVAPHPSITDAQQAVGGKQGFEPTTELIPLEDV